MAVEGLDGVHASFTVPDLVCVDTLRKRSPGHVYLRASQRFHYADGRPGERKVVTREYAYAVFEDAQMEQELCSWEWQPQATEGMDEDEALKTADAWNQPHVHVRRGRREAAGLGKLHFPTGRVAFEQVLWHLWRDHEAQPTSWEALRRMRDSLRRFQDFKTW